MKNQCLWVVESRIGSFGLRKFTNPENPDNEKINMKKGNPIKVWSIKI